MEARNEDQIPTEPTRLTFADTVVRPPNTPGFNPWNSKGFVRQVEDNPTNSLNNIFGNIANDTRMCFLLQLIVAMASLPHLGFCAALNLRDNLETLLKAYGAVVYYTKMSGAIYYHNEELDPVFKSGLFAQILSGDVVALVKEGEKMCKHAFDKAIKNDPSIKSNRFHFFSLNTTFQNYITRNQDLIQRVMPVVHACRFVMKDMKMTIPGILFEESLKSQNFVLAMFHAPRMGVPYISWDSRVTAKACMAIQLYKQNSEQIRYDKCSMTDVFDHFHFMTGLLHGDTKALEKFDTFIEIQGLGSQEVIDILLIYNKLVMDSAFDIGVIKCLKTAIDEYRTNTNFMTYHPHTVIATIPSGVVTKELVDAIQTGKPFMLPPELISVCGIFNYKYIVIATYLRDQDIAFHPYSSVKELNDIFDEKCKSSEAEEVYQLPKSIRIRLAAIKDDSLCKTYQKPAQQNCDGNSRRRRHPLRPPQS
jgi:uncharacterized protein YqgQ